MDGEVDLLGKSKCKIPVYSDSINSQQIQSEFDDSGAKKVESFARPFLKKGSGLSRFYKGDQGNQYIKLGNRKPAKRVQIHEPTVSSYPTKENGKLQPAPETYDSGVAKFPLKDNTNSHAYGEDPEDAELKIFEALEKATGAASFCSTSSLAARFLETNSNSMIKEKELESFKLPAVHSKLSSHNEKPVDDLYSPPSSLFGSEEDEDEDHDDDTNDDVDDDEADHRKVEDGGVERETTARGKRGVENYVPIVSLRSPKYDKDIEKLQTENTALKARIVYLEEKMEKNTLEWWSHKEDIMGIVHNLQSTVSRRDVQLENIQSTVSQQLKKFEEEIQIKNQKWCETRIKLVEKVQLLEEEVDIAKENWTKLKNRMQKTVDDVEKELHVKSLEWATTHERLCQRIASLEDNRKRNKKNVSNSQIRSPESRLETKADDQENDLEGDNDNGDDDDAEDNADEDNDNDGVSKILPNGDKETVYFNGTKKIVVRDKSEVRHLYTNGDIRVEKQDGTVKYFYSESSTWQTTYTNGVEYYEFANGQTERRNPNGMVEVVFANGCVKYSHPSGTEECIFADNTILRVEANGERAVVLPNGQQEIHGSDYKKRIYPDGTIKTVYSDGSQETRYPNGRVRIKDVQGVLVSDVTLCKKHSPSKSKLSPRTKPS